MSDSSTKHPESRSETPEMAYEDLAELFRRLGTGQTPTSLHASLAGILAAGHRMSSEDWVHWALELLAPTETVTEGHHIVLKGLYVWTLQSLEDTGLGFTLLLPADDAPLDERLDALSDWSGSFLGAFGSVGVVAEGRPAGSRRRGTGRLIGHCPGRYRLRRRRPGRGRLPGDQRTRSPRCADVVSGIQRQRRQRRRTAGGSLTRQHPISLIWTDRP